MSAGDDGAHDEARGEDERELRTAGPYERIYALVAQIPPGRVASYGQIAAVDGRVTARMVGYAMAALDRGDVPWQRVINGRGTVSQRKGGGGTAPQQWLLQAEGVLFDRRGRVDFDTCGWSGPDWDWLERHGFYPAPIPVGLHHNPLKNK